MRATFFLAALLLLSASVSVAHFPIVAHNTWTSAAPMPQGIWYPGAVAVLDGKIYIAGGATGDYDTMTPLAENQIYDPATNTWSIGVPLPTPLEGGASAVVNGIWYVMGGSTEGGNTRTNATWAYDPRYRVWIASAPMPIALQDAGVAVYNGIIYLVGGNSETMFRANTVESFNPATNNWTVQASLLTGKSEPSVALFGTTIVAADGATSDVPNDNGDNEGYDITTNAWAVLASDPLPRNQACSGGIGSRLYVAGGADNQGQAVGWNESFDLPTNSWRDLAPMPQATQYPASAVYLGRLYCIGGGNSNPTGPVYNYVQVYQP